MQPRSLIQSRFRQWSTSPTTQRRFPSGYTRCPTQDSPHLHPHACPRDRRNLSVKPLRNSRIINRLGSRPRMHQNQAAECIRCHTISVSLHIPFSHNTHVSRLLPTRTKCTPLPNYNTPPVHTLSLNSPKPHTADTRIIHPFIHSKSRREAFAYLRENRLRMGR